MAEHFASVSEYGLCEKCIIKTLKGFLQKGRLSLF